MRPGLDLDLRRDPIFDDARDDAGETIAGGLAGSSRPALRFGLVTAASDSPSMRRCPPAVRTAMSRPSSTMRRTVSTLTPSIFAACPSR